MIGTAEIENRTFDEIRPGERASFTRTLTKNDVEGFAAVSGDFNPTHLSEAYAQAARFKGIVAHGMWTASLISNVLGNKLPGAGTVYLGDGCWGRDPRPVQGKHAYLAKASSTYHVWMLSSAKAGLQCQAVGRDGKVFDQTTLKARGGGQ